MPLRLRFPPKSADPQDLYKFLLELWKLNQQGAFDWNGIDDGTIPMFNHGDMVDNPSSGVHGVTGTVVGTSDAQTLTNKTIDGDDNTVQDLALTSLKTQLVDANKVIRRDNNGAVISGNDLPNDSEILTTDATQSFYNKNTDSLHFELTGPLGTPTEGDVFWDIEAKTLGVKLSGSAVTMQVGQELYIRAKNDSGAAILNGQAVYVSGGSGANAFVKLAKADSVTTACTIAVATEDVADGQFGYFTTFGIVRDVNTNAYSVGDTLFLSAATAGALTGTAPALPNYTVRVAVVVRKSATEGVLLVTIGLAPTVRVMLNDLGALTAKFGNIGAGNFTEIEADGTAVAKGDATCWDDQQITIGAIRLGSSYPTWQAYRGSEVLSFSPTQDNKIFFTAQLSHQYEIGTDIEFHIHTTYPNANAGNSVWKFTHAWASINAAWPTETTVTTTLAAPGVADRHEIQDIATTITGTGKGISSILLCSLERTGTAAADTYASPIYVTALDFHLKKNMLGSRQETVK